MSSIGVGSSDTGQTMTVPVSTPDFVTQHKTLIEIEAERIKKEAQTTLDAERKAEIEAEEAAKKEAKRRKSKKEKAEEKKRQVALKIARHNRKIAQEATHIEI